MTAAVNTDQYVSLARRGQEITTAAAESFAGSFKAYADAVIPQGPRPVDPQAATVAAFDLAERLLTAQRTFAPILDDPRFEVRRYPWFATVRLSNR